MSRTGKILRVALALGVVVLAIGAFVRPAARHGASPTAKGPKLRITPHGLVLTDAEDLASRIRRSRGKGVLVSAWASWCEACKGDFPVLVAASKKFAGSIDVFFVSVDEPEDEGSAVKMLASFGAPGPAFIVEEDIEAFKAKLNPRWPGMLPATFLFDTTGKLRYFWGGPVEEDELAPLLARYLAGETIDGEANFALAPGAVTR